MFELKLVRKEDVAKSNKREHSRVSGGVLKSHSHKYTEENCLKLDGMAAPAVQRDLGGISRDNRGKFYFHFSTAIVLWYRPNR